MDKLIADIVRLAVHVATGQSIGADLQAAITDASSAIDLKGLESAAQLIVRSIGEFVHAPPVGDPDPPPPSPGIPLPENAPPENDLDSEV